MAEHFDIDECEDLPCKNNGVCEDGVDSYTCDCKLGYAGERCEKEVYDCVNHACQNGATCIARELDGACDGNVTACADVEPYSCQCPVNYHGELCAIHVVPPGWSEWAAWSECTRSCEGGIQRRTRTCNEMEAIEQEHTCEGAATEGRVCNLHPCPECVRLRRPYQGMLSCEHNETEDLTFCTVACSRQFVFSAPVLPVYICGRNTSHLWPHQSPDNPRCVFPACVEARSPKGIAYGFRSTLAAPCTSDKRRELLVNEITKRAAEFTAELECIREGICYLNQPQLSGCRYRRDTLLVQNANSSEASAEVLPSHENSALGFEVVLSFHEGPKLAGFTERNEHLLSVESEVQQLGKSLRTRSKDELFIEVEGQTIYVDEEKATWTSQLQCPSGTTPVDSADVCVECPPGSYYWESRGVCILCDEGSFQSRSGQTTCDRCTEEKTTYGRGALVGEECYTNGTVPPDVPDEIYEALETVNNGVPIHMILVAAVVAIICLTVTVVTIVVVRKRCCAKYDVENKRERKSEVKGNETDCAMR